MSAARLPGNVPCVRWSYSRFGEQDAPSAFQVFARDDGSDFDFDTPVGTAAFVPGRRLYTWTGEALSAGDVRYYTVRAITSGDVLSLIRSASRCSGLAEIVS